jgi:hypothetical protein
MTKREKSEIGRAMAKLRKIHGGGCPKIIRECPHCAAKFGTAELRAHLPQCRRAGNRSAA